jgi:hypothetical protein
MVIISTDTGWKGEIDTSDIAASINSWSITPSKDNPEITNINQDSKKYIEGLVGASVSFEGGWIPGQSKHRDVYNHFLIVGTDSSSTDEPLSDDHIGLHLVLKPIDSDRAAPDNSGAKIFCRALASGMSFNVDGGSPESFSFDGVVDGDMYYIEGTSTNMGLPTK